MHRLQRLLSTVSSSACSGRVAAMSTVDLFELLSASVHVATAAATVVSDVLASGELHAKDKAAGAGAGEAKANAKLEDPQTIADLRAQNLIVGSLRSSFPNIKLVGEEGDLEIDQANTIQPNLTYLKDFQDKFPSDLRSIPSDELCLWIGELLEVF
jgi:hypothetical protein